MSAPGISIVVCTRDRAASLRELLRSLAGCATPPESTLEVLIVDNGSRDDTRHVVEDAKLPNAAVRYTHEPARGLSRARNRGVRDSGGAWIVFIDDDVRVAGDWLLALTAPLRDGTADGAAGGVTLAPHLRRPWMTKLHRSMLAEFGPEDYAGHGGFVGANMAISRRVFDAIGGFDEELGAGALGTGEEVLFSRRLRAAGSRIADRTGVTIEHHFDAERLERASFARTAEHRGRYIAWMLHHWEHERLRFGRLRAWRLRQLRRAETWKARGRRQGAPITAREILAIQRWAFADEMAKLGGTPRLYAVPRAARR